MDIVPASEEGIAIAADAICNGQVVAYPTGTVYGLAADPHNPDAVDRLFHVKGRPVDAAVIILIGQESDLSTVVSDISPIARACIEAYWPGPLSIVFPKAETIPEQLTGGRQTVCVRLDDHPVTRMLCSAVGSPITSTSANRTGQPPATLAGEIDLEGIAVAIDSGACTGSTPSTIIDAETGSIIRQGAIAAHEIERIIEGVLRG